MKILMVSSFLPHPLTSGGHIRLYNLMRQLSENHAITLVCEKRPYQTQKDIDEVKKYCKEVITADRKKQWSLANILRSGFSSYPFLMTGHTSVEFRKKIEQELNNQPFDVIHIETFYVMQNLPQTSLPVILVEHNIEYLVYQRYVQNVPLFLKPILYPDILKMKYWEEQFWKRATKVVAVSESEKKIVGREDTGVVPNGVDIKKFQVRDSKSQKQKKERRVLFIGDFKWVKNIDALEWLLKDIWPSFAKASEGKPEVKLWVVGKNIPRKLKQFASSSIIFDEDNNESTEDIFKKAELLLAPIRVGGGTSFKILEAMACGVPVVTTTIGAEGMTAKNNKEFMIADTKEEIVLAVELLISDKKLYQGIQISARKLIEKEYDWKIIAKKLEEVYRSVI